jgi:organic radical activating enzyme
MKTIPIVVQNVDRIVRRRDYDQFGDKLLVTSWFRTIQGEGPYTGQPAVFLRLAGCNFGDKSDHCSWCFPSSTGIHTPQGKMTVGEVSVGNKLYALDDSGRLVHTTVRKVMKRKVDREELVKITYLVPGNKVPKTLVSTREHPFHTTGRGFVEASELKPGEKIYHVTGTQLRSAFISENNPMKDPEVAKAAGDTARRKYSSGDLIPYERTAENRELQAVAKRGERNPMKRHEVRLKSALGHDYPKSGLEEKFERAFQTLGLEISYTGNTGNLVVGNNTEGYCLPDFVIPKTKKVVEVYDTGFKYLNTRTGKRTKRTVKNYEMPLRDFYESMGYEVLFLTNNDLPKVGKGNTHLLTANSYSKLKEKVGMFKRNGAEILSVEPVSALHYGQLRKGQDKVEVTNFSCHPYNTFVIGNLHTHNCDTSFQFDKGTAFSFSDLMMELMTIPGYNKDDILVITGGEPTLQDNLLAFVGGVEDTFRRVQIETNGTQASFFRELGDMEEGLFEVEGELMSGGWVRPSIVVSPKGSTLVGRIPKPADIVLRYASCLKFVVTVDESDPQHTIPDWALEYRAAGGIVYVSPMAVYAKPYQGEVSSIWDRDLINAEATSANYAYAAKYAMDNNLYLSLQTHLFCALP